MPNNFLTPQIIAREALAILTGNLVYGDLVDRRFDPNFTGKVGDTITIRKRQLVNSKYFDGKIEKQGINEDPIPVVLDRWRDTTVEITSKDLTLNIVDFSKQVLEPIMLGLATDINADIAAFAFGNANKTIGATANPTNLEDIAKIAKELDNRKAPKTDRALVLSPDHKYKYALTDNLSKVAYAGDNETLREALLGKIYSLNTYMDQDNPNTEAATAGTATSYKVTGVKGEKKVQISALNTATATVKKGDKFIVNGYIYTIAADGTGVGNAIADQAIEEKLQTAINDATAVVVINKPTSVAFHKEAIAMVNVPLANPEGAVKAYTATAKNMSVRVVMGYDMDKKTDILSIDVLYGLAVERKELIVGLA